GTFSCYLALSNLRSQISNLKLSQISDLKLSQSSNLRSQISDLRFDLKLFIGDQLQSTEPPVPSLIIGYRLEQMHSTKVGPKRLRYVDLAVCRLPQQEVRDP